jgi:signal transduction histidine kinase
VGQIRLVFSRKARPALIFSRGRIVAMSIALARLLGNPGGKRVGRGEASDFVPARQPAQVSRRVAQAVGSGAEFIEFPMIAADGATIMMSGVPIEAEWNGRQAVLVAVYATARRRKTAELRRRRDLALVARSRPRAIVRDRPRQAHKMEALGALAEGVAHELNNLLQPITLLSELALQRLPEDSREADYLRRTVEASQSAREIVQRILGFGRADEPTVERLEIGEFVRDAIGFVRLMLPSSISLRTDIALGVGVVCADRTRLTELLMNLASNAKDAIGSRVGEMSISLERSDLAGRLPPVRIGALRPGAYAVLKVRDRGAGMSRDTLRRIFDPFFTTKNSGEGTGLGLSTIRGIVVDHRGALQVHSKRGQGSTFVIYLPIVGPDAPDQRRSAPSGATPRNPEGAPSGEDTPDRGRSCGKGVDHPRPPESGS